jgi:hypothetical protein
LKFNWRVHFWTTVIELKEKILEKTGIPISTQRLFAKNCELENNKTLESYGIMIRGKNKILLIQRKASNEQSMMIEPYGNIINKKVPSKIKRIIEEIEKGMALGLAPQLAFDGTSGAYMMRDQNKSTVAIFKPIDEEAYAPNNPRGYIGVFGQTSFRSGVLSGEGVIREVASYLLDHQHFSWVPPTIFCEAMHPSFNFNSQPEIETSSSDENSEQYNNIISSLVDPALAKQVSSTSKETKPKEYPDDSKMKYGSLQYFVKADDVASNFSYDLFSVDEVHKIGILDLRIFNLDRNDGNILVKKEPYKSGNKIKHDYKLIPIDHAMSIPDNFEVYSYDICWMDWEQADEPFSEKSLNYIKSIDVLKDIKMLDNSFKFRKIWLRNIRITGILLKKGAELGLTLHQIVSILCREDDYEDDPEPSMLEKIIKKAEDMAKTIRRIKATHSKSMLDSVETLKKNSMKNRRTSLKNKHTEEIVSKLNQKNNILHKNDNLKWCNIIISEDTREETKIKEKDTFKSRISAIKKGFDDYENASEGENQIEVSGFDSEPGELKMAKFTSMVITSAAYEEFDLSQVGQKISQQKRERAQSENDSELIFTYDPVSAGSSKKFKQKTSESSKGDKNSFNDAEGEEEDVHHSPLKMGSSYSSSEDEDEDVQNSSVRSPPIKRTTSLPRIKMLENRKGLPKIREEDEDDPELEEKKTSNVSAVSVQPNALSSMPSPLNGTTKKYTPPKITRQKSEELEEIQFKDSPYDEDFFYYFEAFLVEAIKKMIWASTKKIASRGRSKSEV